MNEEKYIETITINDYFELQSQNQQTRQSNIQNHKHKQKRQIQSKNRIQRKQQLQQNQ